MNKTNLQKELKERVKPGIKPSNLKKKIDLSTNPIQEPKSKENLTNNPPLLSNEDEGYISDTKPNKSLKNLNKKNLNSNKTIHIQQLEQEVKFWSQTANNHLTNLQREQAENENLKEEIKELKKIKPTKTQQELEKALQEANQKIRKLEQEKPTDYRQIKNERDSLQNWKDNWQQEQQKLLENQKPADLPDNWRELFEQIDDLKKRPTQEALNKAVQIEKDKHKDYEAIKETLKTWTDIFGTATAEEIKKKLEAKTPSTTLTDDEKEAIANYAKLKKDCGELKNKNEKESNKLKNEIKIKNAEIDRLKGWKTQPVPDNLVNQINQKIIQAYNSTYYLNGYYEKLMKQFLNWEVAGTEEQRNAVLKTKLNINKCLDYLENVAKIKNPLTTLN